MYPFEYFRTVFLRVLSLEIVLHECGGPGDFLESINRSQQKAPNLANDGLDP